MRLKGKNVLIYGLSLSGIAATNFLLGFKANVFLYDDNKKVLKSLKNTNLINGEYEAVYNFDNVLLNFIDLIVVSPSVSVYNENIKTAILKGVRVISEVELGFLKAPAPVIAVTGTNGKTTTIRMLESIFNSAKINNGVVGNIGTAFTEFLTFENRKSVYLAEVSSFQLESSYKFKPYISAILNITPDHMDRHFTLNNYINQKKKIFANQKKKDFCVLNYDDENLFNLKNKVKSKLYFYSTKSLLEEGLFINGGNVIFKTKKQEKIVFSLDSLQKFNPHNLSNALCATLISLFYGLRPKNILEGLNNFDGVSHRLQFVRKINDVNFYNDSKATNIDACIKAVNSFKQKVVLILGGSDKGEKYEDLFKNLPKNVKRIIVTGGNKNKIIKASKAYNFNKIEEVNSFEEAIKKAYKLASKNNVVLLSPASASFDSFKDYKHRGEEFVRIVKELK